MQNETRRFEYSKTVSKDHKKQESWVILDNEELVPGEKISGRIYCSVKKPVRITKIMLLLEAKTKVFNGVSTFPRFLIFFFSFQKY